MQTPPFIVRFPVHAGCRRADVKGAPAPKPNQDPAGAKAAAWRLYYDLERHEAATKEFGKHNGSHGKIALAVLRALITFVDWDSGQCDPSYAKIGERAGGICERSVRNGIYALQAAGVLEWIPRCVAAVQEGGGFILRQISHLFSFKFDPPWRRRSHAPAPEPGTWGDHPSEGDALDRMADATRAGVDMDSAAAIAERNRERKDAGEALAKAWRTRRRWERVAGKPFHEITGAEFESLRRKFIESGGDS